jgi:pimeloyl-ACP methyl ester carboxylesterase/nucleoside-diphosphate-sugar epimerase
MPVENTSTDKVPSKSIFLSGASTFLGSHFLFWQTKRAQRNFVLVADPSETISKELCDTLVSCAASYRSAAAPEDLTRQFELVTASLPKQSDPINEFWHFPDEQQSEDISEVLELARKHSVGRFIYVSSAYAAGRQSGVIPEQLHSLPREFHNQFEEQQCRAEHTVTNYCREHGINYGIVRPSIVIGPAQTALCDGPRGWLYSFTKAWSDLGKEQKSISLKAQPKTPINLIPVDHAIADLDHLIATNFAGGPIYHLTSVHNPTIETLITTSQKVLGTSVTVRYADSQATNNELPLLDGCLEEKQFERSLPRKDGVAEQELYGYVTECARELRNQTPEKIFNRKRLISHDGVPFTVFEGHNTEGEPVVLINALGMSAVFWVNLAKQLEPHFRVLTWESRWVPDCTTEFDSARCDINYNVKDLVTLLDSHSIPTTHVISWCNGAQVALNFAAHFPERLRSLVLLNGAFNFPASVRRSLNEKNMRTMMPRIKRLKDAEMFLRIMNAGRFSSGESGQSQKSAPAIPVVTSNPSLLHLVSSTYKSPELLYRYANIITQSFNEPDHAWTDYVKVPTLVIGSDEDPVADAEGSREFARRLSCAELVMLRGDHHTFYEDASVQNQICEFLLRHSAQKTAPVSAATSS